MSKVTHRHTEGALAWALAALLALLPVAPARPVQAALPAQQATGPAPAPEPSGPGYTYPGYTYEECNRLDEAGVQAELEAIALAPLVEAGNGLEIDALVARKWAELGVGQALDQEVDAAIVHIQQETGYWERFVSGWSTAQAELLAGEVATAAFEGPVFQAKLEELATALAADLVAALEAHAARSASSALLCLQSYVGERYSATLFTAFEEKLNEEIVPAVALETETPVTISPVDLHLKALGGIGVIVASQITRKIALSLSQKIAGRLAGKIAGRVLGRLGSSVIPYIGWVVGAGLIVWDLVEGAQGALPQIREALQAEEVKQEVRAEIAAATRTGLEAEVQTLAATLAATLAGQWQRFCAEQGAVCTLAAENDDFGALLDATPVAQLPRLAQQVTVYLADLDRTQLEAGLADGSFEAILALPESALAVLSHTHDPQTVLAWAELAGPNFEQVVALELYRQTTPAELSPAALSTLVATANNDIIHKLLAVTPNQLEVLARLSVADLQAIAAGASVEELAWLADYLAGQTPAEAQRIGAQLATGALTLAILQSPPTPAAGGMALAAAGEAETAKAAGVAEPPLPDTGLPAAEGLWNNGVLVAAALLVILLVGFGIIASLRRDSLESSG
ncbi:MAG TPA: hypothetical protein VNK95_21285 [Caldilineaceae bacterium]|nr:hypothetical protein [Caldilineaceae bacterium]